MKQAERSSSLQAGAKPPWGRYAGDSALSVGGVFLITSVIAVAHLYPRIPTIAFVYLLLVLTLASTRGLYAAILTSLLAFLCFDFFFFPPPYTFLVTKPEDLFTLVVSLTPPSNSVPSQWKWGDWWQLSPSKWLSYVPVTT